MFPTFALASVLFAFSLGPHSATWTTHAAQDETVEATPVRVLTTQEVADRYFELTFKTKRQGEWADAVQALFAKDAVFIDPTTEVFGMPLARGIHGAEKIVKEMLSFGLIDHALDVQAAFVCGEYAVFYGTFTNWTNAATTPGTAPIKTVYPLVSMLRVVDGVITERRDYGDYWSLMRQMSPQDVPVPIDAAEATLTKAAESYRKAYAACDWKALGEFWADDVTFQDPTAEHFGADQLATGETEVNRFLQEALTTIAANGGLKITPMGAFETGRFAISLQHIAWPALAIELGIETKDPEQLVEIGANAVIVLEFKDGHVINHRDFVSYETLALTR